MQHLACESVKIKKNRTHNNFEYRMQCFVRTNEASKSNAKEIFVHNINFAIELKNEHNIYIYIYIYIYIQQGYIR